jgi:hypothetical protein
MSGDEMNAVFRVRRGLRRFMLFAVAFFLLATTCTPVGLTFDPSAHNPLLITVLITAFWAAWFIACVWNLVYYHYYQLSITGTAVHQREVFDETTNDLSRITHVHWSLAYSGRIKVLTGEGRFTIRLDLFEREERLWLIRYFRNAASESLQEGWDSFCNFIAIPLRDRAIERDPGPDEVVLTRRRWDWYFIPLVVLSAIAGYIGFRAFQQPRLLSTPLLPILFWLTLRYMTPRQGMIYLRLSADPEYYRFLQFWFWWIGLGLVGFVAQLIWPARDGRDSLIYGLIAIPYLGVFIWRVMAYDRAQRNRNLDDTRKSVHAWDVHEPSEHKTQ